MMSGWAWAVICAPDIFSWNFSFMVINSVQMLFILYRVRPIKFTPELEDVYNSMFKPLKVSRYGWTSHIFQHIPGLPEDGAIASSASLLPKFKNIIVDIGALYYLQ